MAISTSDAPFTYSGNWDITEYADGMFLARFLSSGTLLPKKAFIGDICVVNGGSSGSSGNGGRGGAVTNHFSISISTSQAVTIGTSGNASSFGTRTASGTGASGGNAGAKGNEGGNGISGPYAFNGAPSYFAKARYGGGGGGGGGGQYMRGGSGGGGGGGEGGIGSWSGGVGSAGEAGKANTGGGGGGGGGGETSGGSGPLNFGVNGQGGSGIVLLRGEVSTTTTEPPPPTNHAPTTPSGIFHSAPKAGKSLTISTNGSTDQDGDAISYVWERRVDTQAYVQIGITSARQITDTAPLSGSLYQVRVKAVDSKGAESGYTTGSSIAIDYNLPPTITMETTSLGERRGKFDVIFRVNDPNAGDTLTVTVKNDNTEFFRRENAPRNVALTAPFSYEAWAKTGEGNHTITVIVFDGNIETTETLSWSKAIQGIDVVMTTPVECEGQPKRILVRPDVTMAEGATQKYYACNNGFDPNIVWEDITAEATSGAVYAFTNASKTAEKWGVCVRAIIGKQPGTTVILRRIDGVIS